MKLWQATTPEQDRHTKMEGDGMDEEKKVNKYGVWFEVSPMGPSEHGMYGVYACDANGKMAFKQRFKTVEEAEALKAEWEKRAGRE